MIGNVDTLSENRQRVLKEMNKSLHRVEIVGYDVIAKRARAMIANVERYIQVQVDDSNEPKEAEIRET